MISLLDVMDRDKNISRIEYFCYSHAPVIYKILYDKYHRPEIYKDIRNTTIYDARMNRDRNNNKIYDFKSNSVSVSTDQNKKERMPFKEQLVFEYYKNLMQEKRNLYYLSGSFVVNLLFVKTFQKLKLESKEFIFLDNNRLIYNKLNDMRKVLYKILRANLYFVGCITFILFLRINIYKHLVHIEEEKEISKNYKREIILYNSIFKKGNSII